MAVGFWSAPRFETISNINWLKWAIVTITMFLMAWPLTFGNLKRSVSNPLAPILASSFNMVLIPVLIWPLAALAGTELAPGMIVAATAPSTLASAAVLTRRAGGDDSVAILVTIITNASCFLVMPFWIYLQTGNEVEPGKLVGTIYKLLFFVVLPIGGAQLARFHRRSAKWATNHKPMLSRFALLGILSMVFLGAVKMGLRFDGQGGEELSVKYLMTAAVILLSVHTFVFWSGILVANRMGVSRDQQIAIGFSGSQKTLMIGLSTAVDLGMNIIPIVLYHALQLIVDSVFAERIRSEKRP